MRFVRASTSKSPLVFYSTLSTTPQLPLYTSAKLRRFATLYDALRDLLTQSTYLRNATNRVSWTEFLPQRLNANLNTNRCFVSSTPPQYLVCSTLQSCLRHSHLVLLLPLPIMPIVPTARALMLAREETVAEIGKPYPLEYPTTMSYRTSTRGHREECLLCCHTKSLVSSARPFRRKKVLALASESAERDVRFLALPELVNSNIRLYNW